MAAKSLTFCLISFFMISNSKSNEDIPFKNIICKSQPDINCLTGTYSDLCGRCLQCQSFGDVCESSYQCCGAEFLRCHNFSMHAPPQCLCMPSYQWDSDAVRCFIPVTLPQQLLLIAVYSALGVMVTLGIVATLLHVLRSKLGLCVARKQRRTLEMDIEDAEIQAVLDQPRPPPYCPTNESNTNGTNAAVNAGLNLAVPATASVRANFNTQEPPPAYEDISPAPNVRLVNVTTALRSEGNGGIVLELQPTNSVNVQPINTVDVEVQSINTVNVEGQPINTVDVEVQPTNTTDVEVQPTNTTDLEVKSINTINVEVQPINTLDTESQTNNINDELQTTNSNEVELYPKNGIKDELVNTYRVPNIVVTPPIEIVAPSVAESDQISESNLTPPVISMEEVNPLKQQTLKSEPGKLNSAESEESSTTNLPTLVKFDFNKYLNFQISSSVPTSDQSSLTSPACEI